VQVLNVRGTPSYFSKFFPSKKQEAKYITIGARFAAISRLKISEKMKEPSPRAPSRRFMYSSPSTLS